MVEAGNEEGVGWWPQPGLSQLPAPASLSSGRLCDIWEQFPGWLLGMCTIYWLAVMSEPSSSLFFPLLARCQQIMLVLCVCKLLGTVFAVRAGG